MKRYLFVGPSLPDAAHLLVGSEVAVLPPVAGGDLLRLDLQPGDVVGIIDGYFHQTRAVRHKEILALLHKGVNFLGAASIGALRAAELDSFGMRGVGTIYRDYRDGRLEADDEVALLHGPAESGYRPMSEPLVNIRATLDIAQHEGILDVRTSDCLIAALASRTYRLRSYPELILAARDAGVSPSGIDALAELCANRPANPKRADALLLVKALRSPSPDDRPSRFALARTSFLDRWELSAQGASTAEGEVGEMAWLRVCQLFARDYPDFHRDLVLGYVAGDCATTCGRDTIGEPMAAAIAHAVHRSFIPSPSSEQRYEGQFKFLDQWLTPKEQRHSDLTDKIVSFLVRGFRITPGIAAERAALDALRGHPAADIARRHVRAAEWVNEQVRQRQSNFDIRRLSREQILAFFAKCWDTDQDNLELHALDRGISSLDMLVASAGPYYLLAKYNPATVDFRLTPRTVRLTDPPLLQRQRPEWLAPEDVPS